MKGARTRLFPVLLLLGLLFVASDLMAQATELTSADRLALLYTSQLDFDEDGEPLVKVGIVDGLQEVSFVPQGALTVLPTGPGGPELELPAKKTYTVKLSQGAPGSYRHFIVLGRVSPDDGELLLATRGRWDELGVINEVLEIGSLFAISGTMFDSRESLLVTQGFSDLDAAKTRQAELESLSGEELSLHSELAEYPSATLELTGAGTDLLLRNKDILWVDLGSYEVLVKDVPTEEGKKADRTYNGAIILSPDRDGALNLTNVVPVESVLRGVVPSEMYTTAPLEALKVQAIAARGTLISQIGSRHMADPYNLCDEQHCQVFKGVGAANDSTDKAIAGTRGQILFGGTRIAETYYSSNCGGLSETADSVWGLQERGYLHAHADQAGAPDRSEPPSEKELATELRSEPKSFCNTQEYSSGKNFRWEKEFSAAEMDAVVAKKAAELGHVEDITISERGPGGRVSKLVVVGSGATKEFERELTVRKLFGGLKSALFVLTIERDKDGKPKRFLFEGGGFGHGVGMCQTGAMSMAKEGSSFTEILEHYYGGAVLKTLW